MCYEQCALINSSFLWDARLLHFFALCLCKTRIGEQQHSAPFCPYRHPVRSCYTLPRPMFRHQGTNRRHRRIISLAC